MKNLVIETEKYVIYEVNEESLYKIATFVAKRYYKQHKGFIIKKTLEHEINLIYQEELTLLNTSRIYIAENLISQMIGCIRVMKWDKMSALPIQKIFNINPLEYINDTLQSSYWHVGRFAVDSYDYSLNMHLFKQLMMLAISPIYQECDGYMIAECDRKLLRVVKLLGIDAVSLSEGIYYLGSETIPIYANKKGLSKFYNNHHHLYNLDTIDSCKLKFA